MQRQTLPNEWGDKKGLGQWPGRYLHSPLHLTDPRISLFCLGKIFYISVLCFTHLGFVLVHAPFVPVRGFHETNWQWGCSTEAMLGPTPSCLLYVISTVLLVLYYDFLCLEQLQYVLPEDQFYFLYMSQSICHVYKVVPVSLEKSVSSSNCFFVLFLDYFSFIVCF